MLRQFLVVSTLASAVAAPLAMAADTAEKTTVGGKAYIDLTNINQDSDGVDADTSGTGVDVKRFYVGIDHVFDDTWSANVTTDFNYVGNDGETQVYIKKAFLQAKISDALVVRAGSADLPWVPFVEGLYGYRYVENVLVDHLKFGTSADWGVHAFGKAGVVSYAASVVNGAGYKNPTRSKSMDVEGRVSVEPVKGLTIAAGFYNGKLGQEKESVDAQHTAERLDAVVAYVNSKFRVGAEYFEAKNWKQVLAATTDKADGYSVWGSVNFTDNLAVFARYDDADPSKDLAPDLNDTYFNVGLAFKPRKNVDLALVYKQDKVESGTWSTSNGTIGGADKGKYNEVGIWAQVGF
ncbi:MAG TPA: hypothetical protein VFS24_06095 [Steroidobacteraceae bacterium]|nr:hypothetical protein [Steroidobacteraceae bacterium]